MIPDFLRDPDNVGGLSIGGKARGLALLHGLQAPVPSWLVCPADRAARLLESRDADLRAVYECLDMGHGIAVRSSSLSEDQHQHANAGAFETRFCIHPDEVRDAIAAVLASAGCRTADEGAGDTMAVVFQTRIRPRFSGVLFSAHPSQARPDEAYVEFLAGSPEGLVDGSRVPGAAWLDPDTGAPRAGDNAEALPQPVATELVAWLRRVENAVEWAADIEWAVDENGLWLLQARPLTRLFLHPDCQPPEPATSWFFDQRFGEPLRPITQSLLLPRILEAGIGEPLDMRGVPRPEPLSYEYGGLPYVPIAAYTGLCRGIPHRWLSPDLQQVFPTPPPGPRWLPWPSTFANLAATVWHERHRAIGNLRAWDRFVDGLENALRGIPDADGTDADAWPEAWASLDALTMDFLCIHRWSLTLADGIYGMLRRLPGTLGQRMIRRAERRVHLVTRAANEARERVSSGRIDTDAFVRDFGHRSPSLDYAAPTWAELVSGYSLPALPSADVLKRMPRTRGLLARLLELREEQRFVWEMVLARQRRLLLRAGETLAEQGVLPTREAVWWLTGDELHAAFRGTHKPDRETIRVRQRRHYIYAPAYRPAHIALEETVGDIGGDGDLFVGVGASSGRARGWALVAARRGDLPEVIPENSILVLPCLDPGSTGLLGQVSGLVVERGGLLSHAAIAAREYRVPLVIGIPGIVERLQTGQTIVIDGETGRVDVRTDVPD